MATKKKYTSQDGRAFFVRLAKEGAWAPVYLLMGSEHYLLSEAIERLTKTVFPGAPDDFNYSTFDAKEHSAADVIAACEMLPMFAEKRVVRLRNLQEWRVADLTGLAHYVERPSETTLLIMDSSTGLTLNSDAAKRIDKAPSIAKMGFESMNATDTAAWVTRRGKTHYRLLIRNDLAAHMVEYLGESLETLDRALERLMLFIGAAPDAGDTIVSQAMIDDVVVDSRMRSVFELTDALVRKDIDHATRIYRRMRLHGDSSVGTVAMIAREFRGILAVTEGGLQGADDRSMATLVGGPPWALKKHRENARRFQRRELHAIVQMIAQTAAELTSSRLSDDLHVERLFVRICRPQPEARQRATR